jgi:hypothetical protein
MSSYDVVQRAIEFQRPERLPIRFDTLGVSDIYCVSWNQIGIDDLSLKETVDEWGCTWRRTAMNNVGQVKVHPLENWDALPVYSWPDPDDPAFYEGMEERFENTHDKYVIANLFMLLFERMHTLHGFENTLTDLLKRNEKIEILADRIMDFDLGVIRNISRRFPSCIHGLSFTDDWGTQQGIFINPRLWQEFFKPRYEHIFEAVHREGWHVWMHSCGKINAILEGLIEAGIDVINLQQPRVLGIEKIGNKFRRRICFESLCDIQHTLPIEGEEEIREEAMLLLEHWATPEGGFILSEYGNGEAIGVDIEKKKTMLDAFMKADPYKASYRL